MAIRRVRVPQPESTAPDRPTDVRTASSPANFLPFASYTSVTGVHTSLLAFTALFLPRTSVSFLTDLYPWQSKHTPIASDEPHRALRLLTENPTRTVAWMCVGAIVVQTWWASWLRGWMIEERTRGMAEGNAAEQTKQKLQRKHWDDLRLAAFGNAILTTLVVSTIYYILLVLFGAPIASHPLETSALALLLSLLTSFTSAYVLSPPSLRADSEALVSRLTWIRLFAELSPRTPIERAIVYPAAGTLIGCWSGAIPLGLDWERPWQAWPLPPAYAPSHSSPMHTWYPT
ncbi:hypothetical protein SCP_0505540 [Sparassis crispa]|uniref:Uncharacterized protein n=1 Tax=Sparassis crispa TaxID=139825 RepID=A0A401GMR6_9APHY|nr:hypothetical protein SCP_0505540 [Sparassis crispa]GBE83503.1 hypothetical protein SCP_0505540 [Sparassis crispa]